MGRGRDRRVARTTLLLLADATLLHLAGPAPRSGRGKWAHSEPRLILDACAADGIDVCRSVAEVTRLQWPYCPADPFRQDHIVSAERGKYIIAAAKSLKRMQVADQNIATFLYASSFAGRAGLFASALRVRLARAGVGWPVGTERRLFFGRAPRPVLACRGTASRGSADGRPSVEREGTGPRWCCSPQAGDVR
jgi:hypothetical protein